MRCLFFLLQGNIRHMSNPTRWTMREIPQHHFIVAITTVVTLLVNIAFGTFHAHAQTGVPSANPSVPAQTYDARQLELQRVREAAQRARASAQQAAMARSADRALEEQHIKSNVDRSLEYKQLKAQAAAQAKTQTAPNGYQGVSPGDIKSWQDPNGDRVTIQREVPQQFTETIAREDDGAEEKSGGIGGAVKGVLSWRPSIPFIGKKKKKDDGGIPALPQFTPAEQLGLNDVPPPVEAPAAEPVKEEKSSGGGLKIPLIGGLLGGNKKDKDEADDAAPYVAPAPVSATASQPSMAIASDEQEESSKPGLLSRLNPFSKKNDDDELGNPYEAPTYADYDTADLPSSGRGAAQEASAGLFGPTGASGDTSTVVSSGASDDEDKPGFFGRLFGGGDKSDEGGANNDAKMVGGIYVVDSKNAQLIIFGDATISSDARPMPIGTVVRVTKEGEEWNSVQLTSGAEGIMRKKMLRPAKGDEGSAAMFAHLNKSSYPTTAKITRPRSATGSSSSRPNAPVNVPTPDLPSSADAPSSAASDAPTGNGLLPPLPTAAVE
jgi:hypothetical protein